MAPSKSKKIQQPILLRSLRLMEAFAKSDDERDFYLDKNEGFILYIDLDKDIEDIDSFYNELDKNSERYCPIPKMTNFDVKKIMEGFVSEKVYDIDTKEKLLDIINSKDARENFVEFVFENENELEKWQQYYQERCRIRIIEWLRTNNFHFVFEEDLDFTQAMMQKIKENQLEEKPAKEVAAARKVLSAKAKNYYSNEAINPRPKRGRPPKQSAKAEPEPQASIDMYLTVPKPARPFLFIPDINSFSAASFSSKFYTDKELSSQRANQLSIQERSLKKLQEKLTSLKRLSSHWDQVSLSEEVQEESEATVKSQKIATSKPAKKSATKARSTAIKKAPIKSKTTKASVAKKTVSKPAAKKASAKKSVKAAPAKKSTPSSKAKSNSTRKKR